MPITRQNIIRAAVIVAVFLVCLVYPAQLFAVLGLLWRTVLPLVIGAVMAYCVNLLAAPLERYMWPKAKQKGLVAMRRPLAIVLAFVIIVGVLAGVLRLVVPQFVAAINDFFASMPALIERVSTWLKQSDQANFLVKQLQTTAIDWQSLQGKVMSFTTSGMTGLFSSTVSLFGSLASGVFDFILALTFAIYLIAGKERIGHHLKRLGAAFLPARLIGQTRYVVREADRIFAAFIAGQVLEALILGTLCVLGMWLFRFPDAVPVGALIGICALVPMVGAWIGGIVGFVLIAVTSPLQAVLFVIYISILQQLEGNIIYPRVVGGTIGLPGILVLVAITIGAGLAGIVGMLFAVPIGATIYRLVQNELTRREGHKADA